MPNVEKQNRAEQATPDLACTRCRERKIKCNKERPVCGNCSRDESAVCVFQNPVKRVNHIKLLCDSVERVQDRLTLMESHLTRLTHGGIDRDERSSDSSSRQASPARHSLEDEDEDDGNEDTSSESPPSLHAPNPNDLHVFRNEADKVDRFHGPSSLFVLCNNFRLRVLAARNESGSDTSLQDMLQNLCKTAGTTEPFPSYSDQSLVNLLPKQQAVAAVQHFVQHVDYTTDIFVQSNLFANLERLYSQPTDLKDEAWAICIKTIVLLVLGKEISGQARNALFGDFARSILPSRAALVNSRLLTAPRLINVQTLILLSIAAQQFDPHGWAELLFTHACMLARTMGLHHLHVILQEASADETMERTKVIRSLYSRDKSLCTTRGSICWLPSDDCNLASQLDAAVERHAPFSDRLRMAIVQDDIHRLTSPNSRHRPNSNNRLKAAVLSIEQRLNQFASKFGVFDLEAPYSARRALLPMEFLATRLLALQHGFEPRHSSQVRSDARASCLLLLIAHGNRDRRVIDGFNSLTYQKPSGSALNEDLLAPEVSPVPLASVLDAFSLSAFFTLLEAHLLPSGNDGFAGTNADLDLLRRVSACYNNSTAQMPPNAYHRKVALIFNQLLGMIELFNQPTQQPKPVTAPPPLAIAEQMMPPNHPPHVSSLPQTMDASPIVPSAFLPSDLSNMPLQPTTPSNSSLSWDNWLSDPSSLGNPSTPPSLASSMDGIGTTASNLFAQILGPSQSMIDLSGQAKLWPANVSDRSAAMKRRRTHDELDFPS